MSSTRPRMPRRRWLPLAVVASLMVLALAMGHGHAADKEGGGNVYVTGAEVRIDRAVEGDLVAAAGRIHVDQPIAGDAIVGAGSLDVQAPVGEDLRAGGGIVTIESRVGGEVLIAAGRVVLSPNAEVHGRAWLAGSNISIGGRSLSGVKVYGREVSVLGEIYGPLEISADRIELLGSARIYGDVTYSSSRDITIDPLAHVSGRVIRTTGALGVSEPAAGIPGLKAVRPMLLAGLFAIGVLLHALVPRFTQNSVNALRVAPVKSLALGTALFFSVPPIAMLLVITIIGIPIGIALGASHALALLVSYLIAGFFIAERLAYTLHCEAHRWRLAFLAGALVVLTLATSIPYVGPLLLLLALAGGLGAIVLQAFHRRGRTAQAQPASDEWPAA